MIHMMPTLAQTKVQKPKTPAQQSRRVRLTNLDTKQSISIDVNKLLTLGRNPVGIAMDVDVDLTTIGGFSTGISHKHLQIAVMKDQVIICDLLSSSGTFLNNKQLIPMTFYQLQDGDLLMLAKLRLQVEIGSA